MKQLVPQEAAENRETGERPVRSRHCKQEHTASYMSLSNREGGGGRQTVSQETCQLWYGDDEFQITRFDCTELTFRFKECMYPLRKSILYNPAAYYMIRVGFLSLWPEHTHGQSPAAERDFFYAFLQAASRISGVPLPYISRRIKVMKKRL